jgi:ClpP class serine protease
MKRTKRMATRPKAKTTTDLTAAMAVPRQFRATVRPGEILAIEPQAFEFSYLYTGVQPNDRTDDNIAIVQINGPLEHHRTAWWDSYESIVCRVECAMAGEGDVGPASAVVLCIDSPGGEAAGATWAHRKLKSLRKKYNVPLYAYANEMACSAAYELACAADEIWLPDTGTVGSIGVIATLFDRTEQNKKTGFNVELITSGAEKADNHADRVIDDGVRSRMQGRVDELATVFWRVVAKARGTSPDAIASLEAGVFIGHDAVAAGIADGVAGWDRMLKNVAASLESDSDNQSATDPVAA